MISTAILEEAGMKKALRIWTMMAAMAASIAAQAQDNPNWVETRFERVYLANGNFIDGHLVEESERLLTFRIVSGEIAIRKDMIQRNQSGKLRVELVKMRSYKDAPTLQATATPKSAPAGSDPLKEVVPTTTVTDVATETVVLKGSAADQLEQAKAELKSGTPARKKGAIEALGKIGPLAIEFLADLLPGVEDDLVVPVAQALQASQDPAVIAKIRPLLSSDRPSVREQAVLMVGGRGSAKEDAPAVRAMLNDREVSVRGAAISALRMLQDFESFDLIAEFLTDGNSTLRSKSIATLTEFAQKGGLAQKLVETYTKAIRQSQDQIRMDLIVEAAKLGSKDLGGVLSQLAQDRDPMVRSHAIMGIGKINAPEYNQLILDLLATEREYWPRIQLAGAVQAMHLDAGIDKMIEWLDDQDSNIKSAALRALRTITRMNFGGDRGSWANWREKTKQ
jgi:HEAT repeat protein